MTLCDASFLIALINEREPEHLRCVNLLPSLALPLVTTWPCFTEAMHLLHRFGGWPAQQELWSQIESGLLKIYFNSSVEQIRMRSLMEQYRDLPMDLADASLVVAAESQQETLICTLDRDFYVYRLKDDRSFSVIPNLFS